MIVYKLTNQDMRTRGGFKWELGKAVTTSGEGALCTAGWLHAYEDPLLAVLHNPIHVDFNRQRLFKAETGAGKVQREGWMKLGASEMTLTEEMVLPVFTTNQRVAYAIYCAQTVCRDEKWNKWAGNWLSGEDRTYAAAYAASAAAAAYAYAAAAAAAADYAAAADAAYAAYAAKDVDLREMARRAHQFEKEA